MTICDRIERAPDDAVAICDRAHKTKGQTSNSIQRERDVIRDSRICTLETNRH